MHHQLLSEAIKYSSINIFLKDYYTAIKKILSAPWISSFTVLLFLLQE